MECTARSFLPPHVLQSQHTDQPQAVWVSDPLGQVLGRVRTVPLHLHDLAKQTRLWVLQSLHLVSRYKEVANMYREVCTECININTDIDASPVNLPLAHG